DAFQVIALQYPAMIKPYIAVLMARASTDIRGNDAAYRAKVLEELAKPDIMDGDSGSFLRTFMSLTPVQRAVMLKEVITIMRGGQLHRAISLAGQRLGWSWTPMIFPTSGHKYALSLLLLIQDPSRRSHRALFLTRAE
ncbi:MAG: hypothetical protein LBP55_01860, partial [Candidatus Adiutrix sp.]|nr:hypothetical protein [Candidatus Adiutrix sp.]